MTFHFQLHEREDVCTDARTLGRTILSQLKFLVSFLETLLSHKPAYLCSNLKKLDTYLSDEQYVHKSTKPKYVQQWSLLALLLLNSNSVMLPTSLWRSQSPLNLSPLLLRSQVHPTDKRELSLFFSSTQGKTRLLINHATELKFVFKQQTYPAT